MLSPFRSSFELVGFRDWSGLSQSSLGCHNPFLASVFSSLGVGVMYPLLETCNFKSRDSRHFFCALSATPFKNHWRQVL